MPRSVWKISAPGAQRFGEGRAAERHDHELLEVDAAVGVGAAVQDVHHRHRQHRAAVLRPVQLREVHVERHARRPPPPRAPAPSTRRAARWRRGVPCSSRAVELRSSRVDGALVRVAPGQRLRDLAVDVARPPWLRPCRDSASCRRRAARAPRAGPWTRRTGTAARPTRLPRASRRLQPSDCRANRESRGRAHVWIFTTFLVVRT